jgi:hypothetical protein
MLSSGSTFETNEGQVEMEINRVAGFTSPCMPYNLVQRCYGSIYDSVNRTRTPVGMGMVYGSTVVLEWPQADVPAPQEDGFHRIHELRRYVRELSEDRGGEQLISPILAHRALELWWKLWCSMGGQLNVPDASPGPNRELLYVWNQGEHYLSVETQAEGLAEFFYRNAKTGEIWGYDYVPEGQDVPKELKIKLRHFLRGE